LEKTEKKRNPHRNKKIKKREGGRGKKVTGGEGKKSHVGEGKTAPKKGPDEKEEMEKRPKQRSKASHNVFWERKEGLSAENTGRRPTAQS